MEQFQRLREKGFAPIVQFAQHSSSLPLSCGLGVEYFRKELGDTPSGDDDDFTESNLYDFFQALEDGIFHCYIESDNYCHYFTLFLEENSLAILNTWCDFNALYSSQFSRGIGLKQLKWALEGNATAFRSIFGLPPIVQVGNSPFNIIRYRKSISG